MRKLLVTTAMFLAGAAGAAQAAPIQAGFPAPGGPPGTSVSSSGAAANTGGLVRTYSNFDPSAWSELYFGFSSVEGPVADQAKAPMTYLGQFGNDFTWQSTTNWTFGTVGSGTQSQPVTFKVSFWDAANSASLTGNVVTGASQGIANSPVVLKMDAATLAGWGGGFTIRAAFTVGNTTTGINNFYNSFSTPCSAFNTNCVQSATTGTFYYDPPVAAAVPEPASLLLLGTGMLAIGQTVRRRRLARA